MALELYRPFVIAKLVAYGYANNVKGARRFIERERPGGMGGPGGSDPRPSRAPQPRAHAAPPRHPGLRTGAGGRQGHPHPSAGVRRVQRGFRRRPDGRARAAFRKSGLGSALAHALHEEPAQAGRRRTDRRPDQGHGPGRVLPDPDRSAAGSPDGRQALELRQHGRSGTGLPARETGLAHSDHPADRHLVQRKRRALRARAETADPDDGRPGALQHDPAREHALM